MGMLTRQVQRLEDAVKLIGDLTGIGVPIAYHPRDDINTFLFVGARSNADGNPKNTPEMFTHLRWVIHSRYAYSRTTYIQTLITSDNRQYRRVYDSGWTAWKEC